MAMLKNIFRNGGVDHEALAAELEPILDEIRAERAAVAELVDQARRAREELQDLTEPLSRAQDAVSEIDARTEEVDRRLAAFETIASQIESMERSVREADGAHKRVEQQLVTANDNAQRMSGELEELAETMDAAVVLREQIKSLLSDDPIAELADQAADFDTKMRDLQSTFAQIRGQQDEVMRGYESATKKLDRFDGKQRAMRDDVRSADQRVAEIEKRLEDLREVAGSLDETRRQMDTLNSLAGYVTTKVSALEQQRGAVERASAQAQNLQQVMAQIDKDLTQQTERAQQLSEVVAELDEVKALHERVQESSRAIQEKQSDLDTAIAGAETDLAGLRADLVKTMEKFDLENRGLDSVSQRIVDLRSSVKSVEERIPQLEQARKRIGEVHSETSGLALRFDELNKSLGHSEQELDRVKALYGEVERLDSAVTEVTERVGVIEEARPSIDDAVADLRQLEQSREAVRDTLERMRHNQADLSRFLDAQSQTRTWLGDVEGSLEDLQAKVGSLTSMRPKVELFGQDLKRVLESVEQVESRGEFVEALQVRIAELGAAGSQLEDRTQQLDKRMAAAEKRFKTLNKQAKESERISELVGETIAHVEDAEKRMADVLGSVSVAEGRNQEVEALAVRLEQLGGEIEQRDAALKSAAKKLSKVSKLRSEAAAVVEELNAEAQKLSETSAMLESRGDRLETLSGQLGERGSQLDFVEKRMTRFEERLASWSLAEEEVNRALEEIALKQGTIDSTRADIKRMLSMTEQAMEDVRGISAARAEVRDTHDLLKSALERLADAERVVDQFDKRKHQIEQAESRLARTDALVINLQSSLETLEGQRALVDRVLEQAGALEFQSKQAEALITTLRQERDLASRMTMAAEEVRDQPETVD